ncbi:MAG: HK97 gp10 family phage protein [Sphaerochaetaceae bacterium]
MIELDIQGLDELIKKFEKAGGGDFRDNFELWLEAMGLDFLDIVQDEIINQEIVDTRRLVQSFRKGGDSNVFRFQGSGINLELEVGTNLEYASYVNDGYPLVTENSASFTMKDGRLARWVPGIWEGDRFRYIRGATSGMLLKERFIPGRPYFEDAERIFRVMFAASLEKKLQQWLDIYFG